MNLQEYISHLRSCIASNPPDLGDSDCETILEQLYAAIRLINTLHQDISIRRTVRIYRRY